MQDFRPYPILRQTAQLIKLKIVAAVSFSAAAGFFMYSLQDGIALVWMLAGIFLQAGAAGGLNQLQERHTDALMFRTHRRPLPAGSMHPYFALAIVVIMMITGSLLLALNSWTAAMLGILNMGIYNGLYTPLKHKSMPLAVIFGAFVGAIPPMIGWTSAGGAVFHPTILMIAGFMYLWQIPHFGLLAFKYGQDYRNAGYAMPYSAQKIKHIIFVSMLLLILQAGSFVVFDIIHSHMIMAAIVGFSLLLLFALYFFLFKNPRKELIYKSIPLINIYMMLLLILLVVDQAMGM